MIDPISSQTAVSGLQRLTPGLETPPLGDIRGARSLGGLEGPADASKPTSFVDMIGDLVNEVNNKAKDAEGEVRKLMAGESDNIHRSMIAMQEAGVAFTLLMEVRNKLVESYQELMRMPV